MRVKTGTTRRARHKKVLKSTAGYRMTKNRLYRVAHEAMMHAGQYAYIGRKRRKRDFRQMWITRITAGLRAMNSTLNYSRLIPQLTKANIQLNRKMLSELAARDFETFTKVVETAQQAK
jgi:large subunit ribosomal protein L20